MESRELVNGKSIVETKNKGSMKLQKASTGPRPVKSAFMCYCEIKHSELADDHKKISNAEFDDIIHKAWRELSEEERGPWFDMQANDKVRFEMESHVYRGPWNGEGDHDINKLARPASAFLLFAEDNHFTVSEKFPGFPATKIYTILWRMWNAISRKGVAQSYKDREKLIRDNYRKQLDELNRKYESKHIEQKTVGLNEVYEDNDEMLTGFCNENSANDGNNLSFPSQAPVTATAVQDTPLGNVPYALEFIPRLNEVRTKHNSQSIPMETIPNPLGNNMTLNPLGNTRTTLDDGNSKLFESQNSAQMMVKLDVSHRNTDINLPEGQGQGPRPIRSAFMCYSIAKHRELRDEYARMKKKVSNAELGDMIHQAWREMSGEERGSWFQMEENDRVRFHMESNVYRGPWTREGDHDINKLTKPTTAFLLFARDKRSTVSQKFPGAPASKIYAMLWRMWNSILKKDEAQTYRDREKLLQDNYRKQLEDLNRKYESKQIVQKTVELKEVRMDIEEKVPEDCNENTMKDGNGVSSPAQTQAQVPSTTKKVMPLNSATETPEYLATMNNASIQHISHGTQTQQIANFKKQLEDTNSKQLESQNSAQDAVKFDEAHQNEAGKKTEKQGPRPIRGAFMFYTLIKHGELRDALAKENKKMSNAELADTINKAWRDLSEEERGPWVEMEETDRIRFEMESKVYRGPWTREGDHDVNKLSKPTSAFLLFSRDKRPTVSQKFPGFSVTKIYTILWRMWNAILEKEEAQIYRDREKLSRENYRTQLEHLNRKYVSKHTVPSTVELNEVRMDINEKVPEECYEDNMDGNGVSSPAQTEAQGPSTRIKVIHLSSATDALEYLAKINNASMQNNSQNIQVYRIDTCSQQIADMTTKQLESQNTAQEAIKLDKSHQNKKSKVTEEQAPRPIRSAFMCYTVMKHRELREIFTKENKKISNAELADMINKAWKDLSEEERGPWVEMEENDRDRFEMESNVYKGPWKGEGYNDMNKLAKPISAFFLFAKDKGSAVSQKYPGFPATKIYIILWRMWNAISKKDEAQTYKDREKLLRENYRKQLDNLNRKYESKHITLDSNEIDRDLYEKVTGDCDEMKMKDGNDVSSPAQTPAPATTIRVIPLSTAPDALEYLTKITNASMQNNSQSIQIHRISNCKKQAEEMNSKHMASGKTAQEAIELYESHQNKDGKATEEQGPRPIRSAFMCYTVMKHRELCDAFAKENKKMSNAELADMINKAWRDLSEEERGPWVEMEENDRDRFEMESNVYKGSWKGEGYNDMNKLAKPISAFFLFAKDKGSAVSQKYPGFPATKIYIILWRMWNAFSKKDEARIYRDREKLLRESYRKQLDDLKSKYESKLIEQRAVKTHGIRSELDEETESKQGRRPIRSAFMCFSIMKHKELRDALAAENKNVVSNAELADIINRSWKDLSEEERGPWYEMEKNDRVFWDMESKVYKGPWKSEGGHDNKKLQKPTSAFFLFSQAKNSVVKQKFPGFPLTKILVILWRMWRRISQEEAQIYKDHENLLLEKYKKQLDDLTSKYELEQLAQVAITAGGVNRDVGDQFADNCIEDNSKDDNESSSPVQALATNNARIQPNLQNISVYQVATSTEYQAMRGTQFGGNLFPMQVVEPQSFALGMPGIQITHTQPTLTRISCTNERETEQQQQQLVLKQQVTPVRTYEVQYAHRTLRQDTSRNSKGRQLASRQHSEGDSEMKFPPFSHQENAAHDEPSLVTEISSASQFESSHGLYENNDENSNIQPPQTLSIHGITNFNDSSSSTVASPISSSRKTENKKSLNRYESKDEESARTRTNLKRAPISAPLNPSKPKRMRDACDLFLDQVKKEQIRDSFQFNSLSEKYSINVKDDHQAF